MKPVRSRWGGRVRRVCLCAGVRRFVVLSQAYLPAAMSVPVSLRLWVRTRVCRSLKRSFLKRRENECIGKTVV